MIFSEAEHPLLSVISHDHNPAPTTVWDEVELLLHKKLNGPVPPEIIAEIGVRPSWHNNGVVKLSNDNCNESGWLKL